jgi:GTPase
VWGSGLCLPPVEIFLIYPFHAPLCSITPIFTLSSVSGESLDLLKVFLNILPPLTNSKEQEELMQQLTEFQVVGLTNM